MGGRFSFYVWERAFMISDSAADFEILHQKPNDVENKDKFDWIKMKKKCLSKGREWFKGSQRKDSLVTAVKAESATKLCVTVSDRLPCEFHLVS